MAQHFWFLILNYLKKTTVLGSENQDFGGEGGEKDYSFKNLDSTMRCEGHNKS